MERPRATRAGAGLLLVWALQAGCASIPAGGLPAAAIPRTPAAPTGPATAPGSASSAHWPVVPISGTEPQAGSIPQPDLVPFDGVTELSVDSLTGQVLARNPSLAEMVAAWQAASARYRQVTSLDDPMFGATAAPASLGSNQVEFGYRLEVSQKVPWCGKLALRGANAQAEASAAGRDVEDNLLGIETFNTRPYRITCGYAESGFLAFCPDPPY